MTINLLFSSSLTSIFFQFTVLSIIVPKTTFPFPPAPATVVPSELQDNLNKDPESILLKEIHAASNPWVLVVDADEKVTSELREYLYHYIEQPDHDDALFIHRKNMFLGKWIKGSYPDSQLRFMDQTKATWPTTIHSHPIIDGTVGHMPKDVKYALVHAGFSVSNQILKMDVYTDEDLAKRHLEFYM